MVLRDLFRLVLLGTIRCNVCRLVALPVRMRLLLHLVLRLFRVLPARLIALVDRAPVTLTRVGRSDRGW